MMLALGGLIALLAVPIGNVLAFVIPLADILILIMGILLLTNRNPFKTLPQTHIKSLRHPYFNAYTYGLLYGPITIPCSGPLVVGIFALSFTAGEALSQLQVFLWFGLGLGMPLLILSFLSAALQRQLTNLFARYSRTQELLVNRFVSARHDLNRVTHLCDRTRLFSKDDTAR